MLVSLATDFGFPVAFWPEARDAKRQDRVRQAILKGESQPGPGHDELKATQEELLGIDSRIRESLVVLVDEHAVGYILAEVQNPASTFLFVRERLGLIDWTTDAASALGFQRTY